MHNIGDYNPKTFHCSRCHGEHLSGTTYICMVVHSNLDCPKCNPKYDYKEYNYCPNCGKKLYAKNT